MKFENGVSIYPYVANTGLGIKFTAKSVLLKTDKQLIIISPANFDEEMINSIKESKLEKVFIAPNNFHNLNIKKMKETFPDAQFFGPKRSEQQSGVKLTRNRELNISNEITPIMIDGNFKLNETCFYHAPSESLVITDLLFNMHHKMNFSTKLALTCAGAYHKLGMSRFLQMTINDKEKFKTSLNSLFDYPFKRVILNHGENITREELKNFIQNFK